MRYPIVGTKKAHQSSIDSRKYRCKKVPAYLSPPLRRISSSSMRACGWRRDLFKNPFSSSSSSSSSSSAYPLLRKRENGISPVEEAEGHTSFWERLGSVRDTRRRLLLFHFPGRNLIWNASSCTFSQPGGPRTGTRKRSPGRSHEKCTCFASRISGIRRGRIRNFTNSDSRI